MNLRAKTSSESVEKVMDPDKRNSVPVMIKLILAGNVVVTVLYVLNQLLGKPVHAITELVDLNGEANLPAWYSSALLLILALLLSVFAVGKADLHKKRSYLLFTAPALFFVLSLDEIAQIHERLGVLSDVFLTQGTRDGTLFPVTGFWMMFLGPVLIVAVAIVGWICKPYVVERGRVVCLFALGFGLFAGSVLGLDILDNFVSRDGLAAMVQVIAEEFGEMLGVTVMIWGALELLRSSNMRICTGDSVLM